MYVSQENQMDFLQTWKQEHIKRFSENKVGSDKAWWLRSLIELRCMWQDYIKRLSKPIWEKYVQMCKINLGKLELDNNKRTNEEDVYLNEASFGWFYSSAIK